MERTFDNPYFFKPVHIQLGDRHFFREAHRTADGRWHMLLRMLGSKKDCEDCIYSIRIFKDDKDDELTYRGSCIALDNTKEKVAQGGNYLNFSDVTAKWFMVNGKINYELKIEIDDWI